MQYISLLPKYIKHISWDVFFFTLKSVFLIQFLNNDQKAAYKQKITTLTFQCNWPRSPRISKFIITERSLQIGIFLCPTKTRCRPLWHFFDRCLPIPWTAAHSCNDQQASQTSVQLAKSNVLHKYYNGHCPVKYISYIHCFRNLCY